MIFLSTSFRASVELVLEDLRDHHKILGLIHLLNMSGRPLWKREFGKGLSIQATLNPSIWPLSAQSSKTSVTTSGVPTGIGQTSQKAIFWAKTLVVITSAVYDFTVFIIARIPCAPFEFGSTTKV
jgi:hypothetical protein